MTEITKAMKIYLLVTSITCIAYGIIYGFLPWEFHLFIDYPFYDPGVSAALGAVLFAFGGFNLIALKKAEWEKIRMYIELGMTLHILWGTVSLWEVFTYGLSQPALTNASFNAALFFGLFILTFLLYRKQGD
ncbi:MAG: hypothetical protein HWN65_21635 [Candidatus Helarchaeota archaeon]|nr:hypothetical protein [Candidatus Helarchaeota archaeon]